MKYEYRTVDYVGILRKDMPSVDYTVDHLLNHESFQEETSKLEQDGWEFMSFSFMLINSGSFAKGLYRKPLSK